MHRSVLGISFLLLIQGCTLSVRDVSDQVRIATTDEVMALTQDVIASAERADVDGTFRYHSDAADASFVVYGKQYNRAELVAEYRDIYAGVERQEITLGNPVVMVVNKDMAILSSEGRFVATMKSGGTVSRDMAWTFVWMRRNEQWQVVHTHQSLPQSTSGN